MSLMSLKKKGINKRSINEKKNRVFAMTFSKKIMSLNDIKMTFKMSWRCFAKQPFSLLLPPLVPPWCRPGAGLLPDCCRTGAGLVSPWCRTWCRPGAGPVAGPWRLLLK